MEVRQAEEKPVEPEAETGAVWPQAQGRGGHRKREEAGRRLPRGLWSAPQPRCDAAPLDSRTAIGVNFHSFSSPGCDLSQQPQEAHTLWDQLE